MRMWCKIGPAAVLAVSFLMASGVAALPSEEASADAALGGPGGEYQALLLEDQQYWLTGEFTCPAQPSDMSELVDYSWGHDYPRTEYAIWLEDHVTASPDGWLCAYRSGSLAYGLHMGNAMIVDRAPMDRLQVWVSAAAGGHATLGFGHVDA